MSLAELTVVAGVPSMVRLRIEETFAISGLCRYRLACLHDFFKFYQIHVVVFESELNSGDVSCFACSCRFPINRTSAFIAGSKKNLVDRLLTLSETDSPISLSPKKLKEMTEKS